VDLLAGITFKKRLQFEAMGMPSPWLSMARVSGGQSSRRSLCNEEKRLNRDPKNIAIRLFAIREMTGMSQQQFAVTYRLHAMTVSRWERLEKKINNNLMPSGYDAFLSWYASFKVENRNAP
jgi:DNA-binding transcriptional regulator YiaG